MSNRIDIDGAQQAGPTAKGGQRLHRHIPRRVEHRPIGAAGRTVTVETSRGGARRATPQPTDTRGRPASWRAAEEAWKEEMRRLREAEHQA